MDQEWTARSAVGILAGMTTRARLILVLAVSAVLGACAGREVRPSPREPTFPLRIERAQLRGRILSVTYVLTNDSDGPVWAACPSPECAFPTLVSGRVDEIAASGTVIRVSSRLVPPSPGPDLHGSQHVPFRRIGPGETRWEATYAVPALAVVTGVELAIGILSCPGVDPLLPLLPSRLECSELPPGECDGLRRALPPDGLRYATPGLLTCGPRGEAASTLQHVSRAIHDVVADSP